MAILSSQAFAQENQDCAPVLQKQFAAIMNAQSGWKLMPSDVSVGSLVEGLYTVTASPKSGQVGSEYLVAIWGEDDCRITSMVEAHDEKSVHDVVWKKDH
jgi:hypothetical protein